MHLERRLRRAENDEEVDEGRRGTASGENATNWEGVLGGPDDAIVLVSPSQSGKTTELRWLAAGLRLTARYAVFIEAGACGQDGLAGGCDSPTDLEVLRLWQDSPSSTLYLVVDAVDEARLQATSLEAVLRRIGREVDCRSRRVRFIFSSRSGSWPTTQSEVLRLGLLRLGIEAPSFQLIAFEPLTLDDIRSVARAANALNLDALIRALRDDDFASLVSLRPNDVTAVVRRWNEHGALGTWTEYLTRQIEAASYETAPGRTDNLSSGLIRAAIERCAAASVLSKTPYVAMPEADAAGGALSSRRLFDDWSFPSVRALFERPLFVPKGPDSVQLPQGAWVPFLAACWLIGRVAKGMSVEELRSVLLVQLEDGLCVVPRSRRATAGWVASMLPEFRADLLAASPVTLLYEGDPQRLSAAEIDVAFTAYVDAVAGLYNFAWPTPATWRRLARPELEARICVMLNQNLGCAPALMEILHFAEHGKYRAAVPFSLGRALDVDEHPQVRASAIRLVGAAGTQEQITALLGALGAHDDGIRATLLHVLPRSLLRGSTLHQFLAAGNGSGCLYQFGLLAPELPQGELDSLIEFLVGRLNQPDTGAQIDALLRTCVAARIAQQGITGELVEALLTLERHQRHGRHSYGGTDPDELEGLVSRNQALRRCMCVWRLNRLESDRNALIEIFRPEYGRLQGEDVEFVISLFATRAPLARSDALSALISAYSQAESKLSVDEKRLVRTRPNLPFELQRWIKGQEEGVAENRARELEHAFDRDEELAREIDALRSVQDRIRSGEAGGALEWAWHQLGDESRIDLRVIRERVGPELTESIRAGFVATWRSRQVPPRDPKDSSIPGDVLLATVGLTLAVQGGLDLRLLTPEEARLAARIGIRELNSFSFWFEELARVHCGAVAEALDEAVRLEWTVQTTPHFGVLSRAAWAEPLTCQILKDLTLGLLEASPPENVQTSHAAVDALISSADRWVEIEAAVRTQLGAVTRSELLVEWLRGWAHLAPVECARWLRRCPAARRDELTRLIAALLVDDLDRNRERRFVTKLREPEAVGAWVHLLLLVVPPGADIQHQGVYTPSPRDKAQDLRRRLVDELAGDPQPAARRALTRLRETQGLRREALVLDRALETQALAAGERRASPWREADVLALERGDERTPASREELFHLVQRHIGHVGRLIENDDFSYRRLFRPESLEVEIQLWAASCLRQRSRRLYSVVRENAVDDDKEVDITAICDGVGQVPIEIKPLGHYSRAALQETITEQLLGRYMRPPDREFGILLLVQKQRRRWKIGRRTVGLAGLVASLQVHADRIGRAHGKIIRVMAIDLLEITRSPA